MGRVAYKNQTEKYGTDRCYESNGPKDIYGTFHPSTKESTFFLELRGTFSQTAFETMALGRDALWLDVLGHLWLSW